MSTGENNRQAQPSKRKFISFRAPPWLRDRLDRAVLIEDKTYTDYVSQVLADHFSKSDSSREENQATELAAEVRRLRADVAAVNRNLGLFARLLLKRLALTPDAATREWLREMTGE